MTKTHRIFVGLLAVVSLIAGGIGLLMMTRLLIVDFATTDSGVRAFLTPFVIYHFLWWCFFASLAIAAISALISVTRGRTSDLVPGPTLYLLGSTLVVNGLFLFMFGAWVFAVSAIAAGILLMLVEYRSALI